MAAYIAQVLRDWNYQLKETNAKVILLFFKTAHQSLSRLYDKF